MGTVKTIPRFLAPFFVLVGALAASAWPAWAQSLPSDPDVVVIGAGSAGIAAAHTLMEDGKSVVVIEAAS